MLKAQPNARASAIIAFAAFATAAQAGNYSVLHDFAGGPDDGANPYNNVSFDDAGNLFGTTNLGGSANAGEIFEISAQGAYTTLHAFDGGDGGLDPNAGVTVDPATGDLYGTTTFGGTPNCRMGCGTLYRLTAQGEFKILHGFDDQKSGRYPAGQLLRDRKGNIYGVTTSGGPTIGGTIFKYTAAGKFKTLHAFADSDGFQPQGNLLVDRSGNLYGATYAGGAFEYGTVFELTPKGDLTTLYTFTGGGDGGYPTGGLARDDAGDLYGATDLEGNGTGAPFGTVFKLAPDGTLTTLYTFTGKADGGDPTGNVLLSKGKLFWCHDGRRCEEMGRGLCDRSGQRR